MNFLKIVFVFILIQNIIGSEEKQFTSNWTKQFISNAFNFTQEFSTKPTRALEIGSWEGRSALWILENFLQHEESTIDCLDPWQPYRDLGSDQVQYAESYKRFSHNLKPFIEKGKVQTFKASSRDTLPLLVSEVKKGERELYNFIYIDGCHVAADVLKDAIYSWDLLQSGGIMAFDDYMWKPETENHLRPKIAIDSVLGCLVGEYDILKKNYQLWLRKK